MSNIVVDARSSGTSTGRYAVKLVENLAKLDSHNHYTILVWSSYFKNAPQLPKNFRFQVADYPINGSYKEQLNLLHVLRKLKPDLVHFTMPQQPILYKGKAVTTLHDFTGLNWRNPDRGKLEFKIKRGVFAKVIKHAVKYSETIITPTNFVKEEVLGFAPINPGKVAVIYDAADQITDKAERMPELGGKKFILYVGRPTPHKNLGRLIVGFQSLNNTQPDLWLVMVGKMDANYRKEQQAAKDLGVKNALFTGFVSEGQLRWLYENCAAYIFPSLSEGFGLPGLEAMAHGAPVITSNLTSLPEVYGDAAEYFDPLSMRSMEDAIEKVLGNKKHRDDLIERGRKQVQKYSWRRTAEQTLDVYKKALGL